MKDEKLREAADRWSLEKYKHLASFMQEEAFIAGAKYTIAEVVALLNNDIAKSLSPMHSDSWAAWLETKFQFEPVQNEVVWMLEIGKWCVGVRGVNNSMETFTSANALRFKSKELAEQFAIENDLVGITEAREHIFDKEVLK